MRIACQSPPTAVIRLADGRNDRVDAEPDAPRVVRYRQKPLITISLEGGFVKSILAGDRGCVQYVQV